MKKTGLNYPPMFNTDRKTKIIATLGPASFEPKVIHELITAGASIFRLNFSHTDYAAAEAVIKNIRNISDKIKKPLGIFIDLQGPKIRIGKFQHGSITLEKDQNFIITVDNVAGNETRVSTTYQEIVKDASKDDLILLDDGKLQLQITAKDEKNIYTKVLTGGKLSDHKGMNLPGMKLSVSALTAKDKEDVLFGISQAIDFFALSFVRTAADILMLKKMLAENNSDIKVIAKIEKPEALENLTEIIKVADAIMVARGDLGVEMAMEKVPSAQKDIIRKTNYGGKPVIVATQMLESMIGNSTPTRAEVSDVATAIYDWADSVMLSGETAVGAYPVAVVKVMAKIANEVDIAQSESKKKLNIRKTHFIEDTSIVSSLCDSADELADEIEARAIITFTDSGRTPLLLSKYRSSVPIIAICTEKSICNRMVLYRGVWPVVSSIPFKKMTGLKQMLEEAERQCLELGLVKKGDMVVMMAGVPIATVGATNLIRVHRLGDPF